MEVVNEVMPTSPERMAAMAEPGPDGPIYMVNLLKFKDRADYEDGRETELGDVTFLSLGQVDDLWDEIAIVKYPNRAALLARTGRRNGRSSRRCRNRSANSVLGGMRKERTAAPTGVLSRPPNRAASGRWWRR